MVRCDVVMANDVSGPVAFRQLEKMGVEEVFDPAKVVMVADHFMPAKDARSAELQRRLKEWSRAQGVTFYDQGRGGIEHTLLCEEGWIVPGVGGRRRRLAYVHVRRAWARSGPGSARPTSRTASPSASSGRRCRARSGSSSPARSGEFVTGKDLILAVLAEIGVGGGTNAALEFVGDGAEALSIDERLAVANMAVEAGAETGLFPADEKTGAYLEGRTERPWTAEASDPDAEFAAELPIDLAGLEPLVALPHLPGNVVPLSEAVGTKIDQAYIGNCSNGTMTDLRQAAEVLRGQRVHPDCRLIVVPATQRIYRRGDARGAARRLRRGGRDGLDSDLRRLLRRRDGRPRAGRARGDDDEPQLQGPDGLGRGRGLPRERVRRRGGGRRRRAGRPGARCSA